MTHLAPDPGRRDAPPDPLRLQPLTRARVASLGEAGTAWLEGLAADLAHLSARWGLELGGAMPGGSASYVARARTADGAGRVLKVGTPDVDLAGQARLLGAAQGRGHALLHGYDAPRNALLLEELGASLEHSPMPVEDKVRLLARTLRAAWLPTEGPWRPRPGGCRPAERLASVLRPGWERLGRPCSAEALEAALEAADRRAAAHRPGECVVVHGDPHPGNLLRVREGRPGAVPGAGSGWVLVDADGFAAEPAYDVGVAMRDWSGALSGLDDPAAALRGWCGLAASLTGTDPEAVWDWALLQRVSTGLHVAGFGAERIGRALLSSADRLVGAPAPPAARA